MYFLGIDVGTTGSRSVLIEGSGKLSGAATRPHAPFESPRAGWAEQHPDDWWRASRDSIRDVIASSGVDPRDIGAIGFSGQMHGAVLLDGNDEPIGPAIIWCDQRTKKECEDLTEKVGSARLIELVSNPALPNFTLPKLLWTKNNRPEDWKRVRSVMLPKDYVRMKLSGVKATDMADGSGTLMLDVVNRKWSEEILELAGIDPGLLPELFESQEVTGSVTSAAASETGLIPETPVIGGAGDNAAGAIGMGIVRLADLSVTIGTSGVVFAVTGSPTVDPDGRIHTLCHAIPETWHVTGVTQAAGLSLQWFRNNFAPGETYDQLTAAAAAVPPGAEGLLWTPYLMGERTPHTDPGARASLTGLTVRHTKAHVARAIMEGVAFSLRDCIEVFRSLGIPVGRIRLGGGGAGSDLWRQIQADIYGRPVEIIEADEGAAFGAAILAGVGAGNWSTVADACESAIRIAKTIEPDAASKEALDLRYKEFRKIYGAVKVVG
ncbi:MAG TPA: xylulokinase [Aridibacter sp.]|nr:xylulokinase [Aridibacter sp.]